MKRIYSKTAFTLIELIVATLLVGVVILGIFSINAVLMNNNQDYGQRYSVKSQTQITSDHILNNAALAVGSLNANDEAILIGVQLQDADPNSFCIHQPGQPVGGTGNNIVNSVNDIWLCYSWINTVANPYQIEWCAENYNAPPPPAFGVDPRGASSCSFAQANSTLITGTSVTFLGTAYSITNPVGSLFPSSPLFSSNGSQLLFSINILNCLNNSLVSCNVTGVSQSPATNPEVQLQGSVIPLQASSS